MYFKIIL